MTDKTKVAFPAWIRTLEEDVIQGEYGYEPGEFTVYPGHWRRSYDKGLTPLEAFKSALVASEEARREREEAQRENWERIKAADAALIAKQRSATPTAALTPEELAAIRDRADAATPGPWLPSGHGFQVLTGDSWNSICEFHVEAQWEDGRRAATHQANAFFVGRARTDVPRLLGLIEAQRAEIERLTKERDEALADLRAANIECRRLEEDAGATECTLERVRGELAASQERERKMREALTLFTKARYQIANSGPANTWSLDRLHEAWVKACDCLPMAPQEKKP